MDAKSEQFMLLAKSAKGLALVDMINKCTAEPGLYTFGELLSLPAVQEVSRGGRIEAVPAESSAPRSAARRPPRRHRPSASPIPSAPLQLQHSEHAAAHDLLQLYAYGTWEDYSGGCPAAAAALGRRPSPLAAAHPLTRPPPH